MNFFHKKTNHTHYCWHLPVIALIIVVMLLSGCASSPDNKLGVIQPDMRAPLINYALSLQGTPYRYGKSSPDEGFDCSGFVQHVYKRYGKRLPRTANDMALALPAISKYDLTTGDLVFFNTTGRTYSHVGIFINDDKFVHASSRRSGVLVSDLSTDYWQRHFSGARRP